MNFGECSECEKYKMLNGGNTICPSCQEDSKDRRSFYEIGVKESRENVRLNNLQSWFDETVPFSDFEIVERSWLMKPYCYCTITYSDDNNKYWYIVREPDMTRVERLVLRSIREKVQAIYSSNPIVSGSYEKLTRKRIELIESSIETARKKYGIEMDSDSFRKLKYYLSRDIVLMDEITGPVMDPDIEKVVYTSNMEFTTVEHSSYGKMPTTASFSYNEIDKLSRNMAERVGESLDSTNPKVDGVMTDGTQISLRLFGDFSPYSGKVDMDTSKSKTIDF